MHSGLRGAEEFAAYPDEEGGEVGRINKKTTSGFEFKRVLEEELKAAGVKDPKQFGESWQDPFIVRGAQGFGIERRTPHGTH